MWCFSDCYQRVEKILEKLHSVCGFGFKVDEVISFSLPNGLGLMTKLKSIVLTGNPMKKIRNDIVMVSHYIQI